MNIRKITIDLQNGQIVAPPPPSGGGRLSRYAYDPNQARDGSGKWTSLADHHQAQVQVLKGKGTAKRHEATMHAARAAEAILSGQDATAHLDKLGAAVTALRIQGHHLRTKGKDDTEAVAAHKHYNDTFKSLVAAHRKQGAVPTVSHFQGRDAEMPSLRDTSPLAPTTPGVHTRTQPAKDPNQLSAAAKSTVPVQEPASPGVPSPASALVSGHESWKDKGAAMHAQQPHEKWAINQVLSAHQHLADGHRLVEKGDFHAANKKLSAAHEALYATNGVQQDAFKSKQEAVRGTQHLQGALNAARRKAVTDPVFLQKDPQAQLDEVTQGLQGAGMDHISQDRWKYDVHSRLQRAVNAHKNGSPGHVALGYLHEAQEHLDGGGVRPGEAGQGDMNKMHRMIDNLAAAAHQKDASKGSNAAHAHLMALRSTGRDQDAFRALHSIHQASMLDPSGGKAKLEAQRGAIEGAIAGAHDPFIKGQLKRSYQRAQEALAPAANPAPGQVSAAATRAPVVPSNPLLALQAAHDAAAEGSKSQLHFHSLLKAHESLGAARSALQSGDVAAAKKYLANAKSLHRNADKLLQSVPSGTRKTIGQHQEHVQSEISGVEGQMSSAVSDTPSKPSGGFKKVVGEVQYGSQLKHQQVAESLKKALPYLSGEQHAETSKLIHVHEQLADAYNKAAQGDLTGGYKHALMLASHLKGINTVILPSAIKAHAKGAEWGRIQLGHKWKVSNIVKG